MNIPIFYQPCNVSLRHFKNNAVISFIVSMMLLVGTWFALKVVASQTMNSGAIQMNFLPKISRHATQRATQRHIPMDAIETAMEFGLHRSIRGADVFTIGWREVRFYANRGLDLSRWEGVEVVCAHSGQVLTVYRNKNSRAMRDRANRRIAA